MHVALSVIVSGCEFAIITTEQYMTVGQTYTLLQRSEQATTADTEGCSSNATPTWPLLGVANEAHPEGLRVAHGIWRVEGGQLDVSAPQHSSLGALHPRHLWVVASWGLMQMGVVVL